MNIHRAPRHFDLQHVQSHTPSLCHQSVKGDASIVARNHGHPGGRKCDHMCGAGCHPPPPDITHRHRNNTLGQFVADEPLLCSLPQKQMAVFLEAGSTPSTVLGSRSHHTRVSLDLQNIGLLRDVHFLDKS